MNFQEAFYTQLVSGIIGYFAVWNGCKACLQRISMALPFLLTTPLTVLFIFLQQKGYLPVNFSIFLQLDQLVFENFLELNNIMFVLIGGSLLWLSYIIITTYLWRAIPNDQPCMLEKALFFRTEYNSLLLEHSLVLNRKRTHSSPYKFFRDSKHFILTVTTMWHEEYEEMASLLTSLRSLDDSKVPNDWFENHIIFDDAFKETGEHNDYVKQLQEVLDKEFKVKIETQFPTYYGKILLAKWKNGTELVIHLKNVKQVILKLCF